jgi:hypothetical protein
VETDNVGKELAAMIKKSALSSWSNDCAGVRSDVLPVARCPSKDDKLLRHRKCWQVGHCICKGRGLRLKKLHGTLQKHIKSFYDSLGERLQVTEGFVLAEFKDSVMGVCQEDMFADAQRKSSFFHISLQYWKPLRTTTSAMMPTTEHRPQLPGGRIFRCDFGNYDLLHGEEACDSHPPFGSAWTFLRAHDYRLQLAVRFWRLVDSEMFLDRRFDPLFVEAILEKDSAAILWDGAKRRVHARRAVAKRHDHIQEDDDEGDGAESSDSSPGSDSSMADVESGSEASLSMSNAHDDEDAADELDEARDEGPAADLHARAEDIIVQDDFEEGGDDDARSSSSGGSSVHSSEYESIASADLEALAALDSIEEGSVDGDAPDHPARRAVGERGPRVAQEGLHVFHGSVRVGTEVIKQNPGADNFYCKCRIPAHGRCIVSRSRHGGTRPPQGRPLGFLAAWYLKASDFETGKAHKEYKPTKAARREARHDLRGNDEEVLAQFKRAERPTRSEEGSEPDDCP